VAGRDRCGRGRGGAERSTHLPLTFSNASSTTLCQSPEVGDDLPARSLSASHEGACPRSLAPPWIEDKEVAEGKEGKEKEKKGTRQPHTFCYAYWSYFDQSNKFFIF
jgi:hypothetical protein